MVSLNPPDRTRQFLKQPSSQDDQLKAKQQCETGSRRRDSGNIEKITKTSSPIQATSALTRWAVRKNCVHSFSTSSKLPPTFRASTKHEIFASIRNCGSTIPALSRIKSSAKGCSQSWTTRRPFFVFPFSRSSSPSFNGLPWKSSTRTLLSLIKDVDPGQRGGSLWNSATFHDAHAWGPKHLFGTPDSRNGLACWRRPLVLSLRTCQLSCPVQVLHAERFLGRKFAAPFADVCLSTARVWRLDFLLALWWSLLRCV